MRTDLWDTARETLRRSWEYPGLVPRPPASQRLQVSVEGGGWPMTTWSIFVDASGAWLRRITWEQAFDLPPNAAADGPTTFGCEALLDAGAARRWITEAEALEDDLYPRHPNSVNIGQPAVFALEVLTGGLVWTDGTQGVGRAQRWVDRTIPAWEALLPARTSAR